MSHRLPGPLCHFLQDIQIDSGTNCLTESNAPGPLDVNNSHRQLKSDNHHFNYHKIASHGIGKLTAFDFSFAAAKLHRDIDPALIHAFAEVESGGASGFAENGLPKIAYEGHIFRKLTHKKFDATHRLLSYPYTKKAGPEWQVNNKNQETAWKTLDQAVLLDKSAALQSCSWGMFQVMGFNYSSLGYQNIDEFVDSMKSGEVGQLDAFIRFCKSKPLMIDALKHKDFTRMAQIYNGDDYGSYDVRIKNAYKRYLYQTSI